jgi:chloride channel protein, CIC family
LSSGPDIEDAAGTPVDFAAMSSNVKSGSGMDPQGSRKPPGRSTVGRLQLLFFRLTSLSFIAEENYLLLAAIVVGVLAGLGSAAFIYSLAFVHDLFFEQLAPMMGPLGPAALIFLPAIGGLVVGPLIALLAPEARGHGVPEVMTAIATRGGRILGRVAVVKIAASAITIGSGGSAGQEGPMVQIGASIASTVGRRLNVSRAHMRTIVACGAAGGLAAVFNAPIGGAIFALEVIAGELTPAFGAVILSSVGATVVSRTLFGNYPSFVVPRYELVSNYELLLYAILGLIAGLVAAAFIRTLYRFEHDFGRWRFPSMLKPAVGGLMVGLAGRFLPQVFGTGTEAVEAAIWGQLLLPTLLLLVPLKILATSVTLGSGGSGGVFGPSMYVGAMLGGAFGLIVQSLFPGMTAGAGAYALVGIGAVLGGTALAPLTAIILLFEMTDDYRIILPVMGATVLSIVVCRAIVGESIYTLKLRQQNIPYYAGAELERAHAMTVRQAMRSDVPAVTASSGIVSALDTAVRARAYAMPVVNDDGSSAGVVTLEQLSHAAAAQERPQSVAEMMTTGDKAVAIAGERLDDLLARIGDSDIEAMAVLESLEDRRPIGIVSRRDVMRLYEQALRRR